MTDINLDELSKHFTVSIGSKKLEDPEDAKLRRFKDKWLFVATLVAIFMIFSVSGIFTLTKPDSAYVGTALNGIIGLTMALAGYYVRGNT